MTNLRIMLCCGAGISSGFLASNARKVAKKQKMNVTVEARSQSEVGDYLGAIDVLMIGPHYALEMDQFKALAAPYSVKVLLIPQDVYATLDGGRLLELAQKEE